MGDFYGQSDLGICSCRIENELLIMFPLRLNVIAGDVIII